MRTRPIAVRYIATAASTVARRSAAPKSRSRAATSMLAARRLTSHSNGPRRVSSKSFTSKTSDRSGDAKKPKFRRCASPHSWTLETGYGRRGEIVRHHRSRAAEEREGRGEHAAVADRDELGNARRRLSLEDLERIALRRELYLRVTSPRHRLPARATVRGSLDLRHRLRQPNDLQCAHARQSALDEDTSGTTGRSSRTRATTRRLRATAGSASWHFAGSETPPEPRMLQRCS